VLLGIPAFAQVPPKRFEVRTDLVMIDAVVTDRQGHPVPGLGRDDFFVFEEGVPQEITAFEAVDRAGFPGAGTSSDNEPAPRPGAPPKAPIFVVYVDDAEMTRTQWARVEGAGRALADALGQTAARVWLISPRQGIDAAGHWPTDREALLGLLAPRAPRGLPGWVGNARFREMAAVDVLEELLGGLPEEPGRKVLLLISPGLRYGGAIEPGLPLGPLSTRPGEESDRASYQRLLRASQRAAVVLYHLDSTGLRSPFGPALGDERELERSALSEGLAAGTGGFSVRNANELRRDIVRIVEESLTHYTLGYSPPPGAGPGSFRHVKVEVRRPGLSIRARSGYFVGWPATTR
jgi:VWFA-related protein